MKVLLKKIKLRFLLGLIIGILFLSNIPIYGATLQGANDPISFDKDINLIHGTTTEKYLDNELKKRNFIGTATLIKNGHVVFQEGYGYANKDKNMKNSGKTTFQIASIQKEMTAVLLMKVATAKKFSLDTSVSHFYPQIKDSDKISLRNLLTMTSGITSQKLPSQPMSDNQFLNYTIQHTKIFKPQIGKMQYQPVNFVLMVGIIQHETKMSYYKYFDKMIKKPLHLQYSYFYQQMDHHQNEQAQGYHYSQKDPYKVFNENLAGYTDQLGTGNLYMSNGDLYRTMRSFLGSQLLTPKQTADLYSNGNTHSPYVAGFYPLSKKAPQLLGNQYRGYHFHGAEYGFETVGDITKDGKTAVIFSSNSANYGAVNNYGLDLPVYKRLIDDSKIF